MCCEVWKRYRNRPWVLLCVSLGVAGDRNNFGNVILLKGVAGGHEELR